MLFAGASISRFDECGHYKSGEPEPSQDDIEITNRLISACRIVGIRILDHVVFGDDKYYSFYNEGLIKEE